MLLITCSGHNLTLLKNETNTTHCVKCYETKLCLYKHIYEC